MGPVFNRPQHFYFTTLHSRGQGLFCAIKPFSTFCLNRFPLFCTIFRVAFFQSRCYSKGTKEIPRRISTRHLPPLQGESHPAAQAAASKHIPLLQSDVKSFLFPHCRRPSADDHPKQKKIRNRLTRKMWNVGNEINDLQTDEPKPRTGKLERKTDQC